jgi:hypothetical protein
MLNLVEKELERRQAFFKAVDAVFNTKFDLYPGNTKKRTRRDAVHKAITEPLGISYAWAPTKRLINEYLRTRGVGRLHLHGYLYFTCLGFKDESRR